MSAPETPVDVADLRLRDYVPRPALRVAAHRVERAAHPAIDEPPPQGRWRISGLGLPGDVLDLVYAGNAARLIPGL